jgi:dTDP-4-dehydrorhamnose reductase
MKVLVTGANGLLGSELIKYGRGNNLDIIPLSRSDVCLKLGLVNTINIIKKANVKY